MSSKSKSTTFLLCYFFGLLGVHRFYLGKFITGILMLLTLGGLFFWWIVDLYRIITGRLKDKQGEDLSTAQPYADQPNAGFWVRFSAITIDGLLLWLIQTVFLVLPLMAYMYNIGAFTQSDPAAIAAQMAPIAMLVNAALLILYVGYFVGLTAGKHQGTYGKRSMGIYVRKRDGGRVWYGHSLVRFVGYFISWIPLGLGYLMAGFSKRKLALHDLIAGTEVVYGTPSGESEAAEREPVTEVMPATEIMQPEAAPVAMTMEDASPSRVPEILLGTGLLLLIATGALAYLR